MLLKKIIVYEITESKISDAESNKDHRCANKNTNILLPMKEQRHDFTFTKITA